MRVTTGHRAWLALGLVATLLDADAASLRQLKSAWPNTDFSQRTVELHEVHSGGVPKDGIPAIDHPAFESVANARKWLEPDEPVIAVTLGREIRAYPIQILIWHEIVNDAMDGRSIAVTFCPLCNASMVFDRSIDGQVLSFGTTGMLRFSDLVMYDRQTESWWQQFTGEGIVGRYAGQRLSDLPSKIVPFDAFAHAFPGAAVLSRPAGSDRPYGRNPYRGYDAVGSTPFAFRGQTDSRLRPMERVLGIQMGSETVVYPLSKLRKNPVINDDIGAEPVLIVASLQMRSPLDRDRISKSRTIPAAAAFNRRTQGRVLDFTWRNDLLVDEQTGSEWDIFGRAVRGPLAGTALTAIDGGVHFAFAWLAFNPQAVIR